MGTVVFVLFTRDELWLMRSVIRHEIVEQGRWSFPPANRALSDKIAVALLFCEDGKQMDVSVDLSLGDTYVLDYTVPQDAKAPDGTILGKSVLLKAFRARRDILDIEAGESVVPEPAAPSAAEVAELLQRMDREVWPWQRRQRPPQ